MTLLPKRFGKNIHLLIVLKKRERIYKQNIHLLPRITSWLIPMCGRVSLGGSETSSSRAQIQCPVALRRQRWMAMVIFGWGAVCGRQMETIRGQRGWVFSGVGVDGGSGGQ